MKVPRRIIFTGVVMNEDGSNAVFNSGIDATDGEIDHQRIFDELHDLADAIDMATYSRDEEVDNIVAELLLDDEDGKEGDKML